MTDKEKAKKIAEKYYKMFNDCTLATGIEKGAMEMAEWKDREIAMLLLNINDMIADSKGHECITFISDYLKMMCEKYCK